jgi:lambda family phage tail tape measure protein
MADNEVSLKFTGDSSGAENASKRTKDQVDKATESVKILDDLLGVKIPESISKMLAESELIGPALDAAFAPLVVISLVLAINDAIEAAKKHREELEKLARDAVQATTDIHDFGESVRISNLRLEDEIRILQKKPAINGPKIAFAEAAEQADKLRDSIQKAIEANNKLLQSQAQGTLARFFLGSGDQQKLANEIVDKYAEFQEQLNQLDEQVKRDEIDNEKEVESDRKKYNDKLVELKNYLNTAQGEIDNKRNERIGALQQRGVNDQGDASTVNEGLSKDEAIKEATKDWGDLQRAITILRTTMVGADKDAKELKQNLHLNLEKDRVQKQAEVVSLDDILHKQNKIVVAKRDATQAGKEELTTEQILATTRQINAKGAQQQAEFAEKAAANNKKIADLQKDIANSAVEHNQAMAVALGYKTQEKVDAETLAALEQEKKKVLADANSALTAQIGIVRNLAQATMGGMLGSPEQKAAYQKAVLDYQKLKIEQLNLEKKYDDQIAALQLKLANSFSAQFRKQLLSWQEINKELGQTFQTALNGMNSNLASFITTGQANWKQLASSAIEQIITIALQYGESQLLMAIMGKGAAKTQTQTKAQAGVAQIEIDSHVAAANAYTEWAAYPPIAALMATAAEGIVHAFAAPVMAVAGASAEGGQYLVPGDQLTMLHRNEMVLPAGVADRMRGVIEGGGGGGISVIVNHSVNAVDAQSFQQHIRRHGNMIGNEVARVLKKRGVAAK